MHEVNTANFGDWLTEAGLSKVSQYSAGAGWSAWNGYSMLDGSSVDRLYVYVSPSCTWQELEMAAKAASSIKTTLPFVVVLASSSAPQLETRNQGRVQSIFSTQNVLTLRKLYYSAALNRNLVNTDSPAVENFVEQRVSFPGMTEPAPALRTIVRWLRGEIPSRQRVAVLLAPAGQGKTTLARQVFHHFSTSGFEATIPVLVNHDTWERNTDVITDMDDIWRHGIRHCYPDAGISTEMLQRSLFLGAICPIFDGLDELCTVLPWEFKPDDSLGTLIDTFEGTIGEGRLLLTSRLTFWRDNISADLLGRILQISLHKFDDSERDDYLQKRFPDNGDMAHLRCRDRARRILSRIATRVATHRSAENGDQDDGQSRRRPYDRIESVPFVVMLAADSADTDKSEISAAYGRLLESTDPLRGLLLALCDREKVRHKMPEELSADVQLELLELLAGEFGSTVANDEVELAISEAGYHPDILGKFSDHSLFAKYGDKHVFTYDFVFDYLCASILLKWFRGDDNVRIAKNVLTLCAGQPGNLLEAAADLIRSVCGADWVSVGRRRFLSAFRAGAGNVDDKSLAGYFHLIFTMAKTEAQRASRVERLLAVFGERGSPEFLDLYLEGSLDHVDLRGIRFRNVRFGDIEFVHCDLDGSTEFIGCRFQGRTFFDNCKVSGPINVDRCALTAQARSSLQRLSVHGVDPKITRQQIEEAITYVLRKFHRGEGVKTVKEEGVRGSLKNEYAFGDRVIDELIKSDTIERIRVGTSKILKLKDKTSVFQMLHNNYWRGALEKARDSLLDRLERQS